jgi:hypothetical protein
MPRLVAEGLGNRGIAEQLNLSEHTVKNYLFNIFDKLGVSSRSELVMYAFCNSDNRVLHAQDSAQSERARAQGLGSQDWNDFLLNTILLKTNHFLVSVRKDPNWVEGRTSNAHCSRCQPLIGYRRREVGALQPRY